MLCLCDIGYYIPYTDSEKTGDNPSGMLLKNIKMFGNDHIQKVSFLFLLRSHLTEG